MSTRKKHWISYYYVQSLNELNEIETINHTKHKNELYHKFLFKKQAKELAKEQKGIRPDLKFRLIKCTEIYEPHEWF